MRKMTASPHLPCLSLPFLPSFPPSLPTSASISFKSCPGSNSPKANDPDSTPKGLGRNNSLSKSAEVSLPSSSSFPARLSPLW